MVDPGIQGERHSCRRHLRRLCRPPTHSMKDRGVRMALTHVDRRTRLGDIRGIERLGVQTYRGIRYADIPKRFLPSRLSAGWDGMLDATTYGPQAMQTP